MPKAVAATLSHHEMPSMRVLLVHDPIAGRGLLEALSPGDGSSLFEVYCESASPGEASTRVADDYDAVVISHDCPHPDFTRLIAAISEQASDPGMVVLMGPATGREIRVQLYELYQRRLHSTAAATPLSLAWAAAGTDAPDDNAGLHSVRQSIKEIQAPWGTRIGELRSTSSPRWAGSPRRSRGAARS